MLYLKEKYRIDVKRGGKESAFNINLTLSFNKSIFSRPLSDDFWEIWVFFTDALPFRLMIHSK